jgi:hypothetical protein
MNLLLDDRLAPITADYGFVDVALEKLADWFQAWETSHQSKRGVAITRRAVRGSLADMLHSLEPLTSVERRRYLFVPTTSSWVAYFDNGWRGADVLSLSYVARELKCRAARALAVPDTMGTRNDPTKKARFGGYAFALYGPEHTLRTISVINDGGKWSFDQSREPLLFEDLDSYRARPIKARFGLEQLDRYLGALGIHAFDEGFFRSEGLLLEREGPSAPAMREYSLREARAAIGELTPS